MHNVDLESFMERLFEGKIILIKSNNILNRSKLNIIFLFSWLREIRRIHAELWPQDTCLF
jgi:hypothetical protein